MHFELKPMPKMQAVNLDIESASSLMLSTSRDPSMSAPKLSLPVGPNYSRGLSTCILIDSSHSTCESTFARRKMAHSEEPSLCKNFLLILLCIVAFYLCCILLFYALRFGHYDQYFDLSPSYSRLPEHAVAVAATAGDDADQKADYSLEMLDWHKR